MMQGLDFIMSQVFSLDAAINSELRTMNIILNNAGVDNAESLEQPADKLLYYQSFQAWTKYTGMYEALNGLAKNIQSLYENSHKSDVVQKPHV